MGKLRIIRRGALRAALGVTVISAAACGMVRMVVGTGAVKPGAEEFGLGPRASAHGAYVAQLEPVSELKVRKMTSVKVRLTDPEGHAVDGALIDVGGGMPQHGHGLPTKPRVTRRDPGGMYRIEGVRFNMGGWWELKLAIKAASGSDVVTFNLAL